MSRPMTMTEKILAAHCGREQVEPGELIECDVDIVLANDVTAPIAIREFEKLDCPLYDPTRVVLVPDHHTPNKDIASAEQAAIMRRFAHEHGIGHFYDVGRCGVEHALLPEQGVIVPGDLVIGADSHTCTYGALGAFATGVGSTDAAVAFATGRCWFKVPPTILVRVEGQLAYGVCAKDVILHVLGIIGVSGALYRTLEFAGSTIATLSMAGRMTICNMVVEAGAKAGLIACDAVTESFETGRAERPWKVFASDKDAHFERMVDVDAADIVPLVACPSLPSNVAPAADMRDVTVDQVFIGSCTNGRIEDFREAAEVLRGRSLASGVRGIVIPATPSVYRQCVDEGLADVFLDAGFAIGTPTCGPCLGAHMGVLAAGERAVATTNRNFVGRMGSVQSEVYLAGPAVAAASGVAGHIALPSDLGGGTA